MPRFHTVADVYVEPLLLMLIMLDMLIDADGATCFSILLNGALRFAGTCRLALLRRCLALSRDMDGAILSSLLTHMPLLLMRYDAIFSPSCCHDFHHVATPLPPMIRCYTTLPRRWRCFRYCFTIFSPIFFFHAAAMPYGALSPLPCRHDMILLMRRCHYIRWRY